MPHVVVDKTVPPDVRQFVAGRSAILRVWNQLYADLEERYAQFYTARNPTDDRLFDYPLHFQDDDRWVRLRFQVDDTTAQGTLFVLAVSDDPT